MFRCFTCNVCRLQAGSPSGACSQPWDPSQIFSLGKLETFSWQREKNSRRLLNLGFVRELFTTVACVFYALLSLSRARSQRTLGIILSLSEKNDSGIYVPPEVSVFADRRGLQSLASLVERAKGFKLLGMTRFKSCVNQNKSLNAM